MLQFVQSISQNENQQQIATVDAEPVEKTFRTYRELKKSDIKPIEIRLRDRHNHFMRLPEEDRKPAIEILLDNSEIYGTNKDRVDLVCKALKTPYEVQSVPNHPNLKVFILSGEYDCVIGGQEPQFYDKIVEYFKTMMNLNWL